MPTTITLDPVTRLEGHLSVKVTSDAGRVTSAQSSGMMFRGFENLLVGKDPRDAVIITQRICGVCPVPHAMAAVLAVEAAVGFQAPDNARIIRNLILGADFLHSHILHFYQLALPSFIQGPQTPPWTPAYDQDLRFDAATNQLLVDHYVQSLAARRQAHELEAVFGGKAPHTAAYEFGGVTTVPNADQINRARTYLNQVTAFIQNVYLPDVQRLADRYGDYYQIGRGYGHLIAFGVFDQNAAGTSKLLRRGRITSGGTTLLSLDVKNITEQAKYAWYNDSSTGLNPSKGVTQPNADKAGAYSWLKAPRYVGVPYEVGPLARMWINGDYRRGISVMDRHMARAQETLKIAQAMAAWLGQIKVGSPAYTAVARPTAGVGIGLTEAPRGALGHWLSVAERAISAYQILTPTCWNASPRDNGGKAGPIEKALEGTPLAAADKPVEVLRVIQSYDPCLSCAVH